MDVCAAVLLRASALMNVFRLLPAGQPRGLPLLHFHELVSEGALCAALCPGEMAG
jgi:hypothetical protein